MTTALIIVTIAYITPKIFTLFYFTCLRRLIYKIFFQCSKFLGLNYVSQLLGTLVISVKLLFCPFKHTFFIITNIFYLLLSQRQGCNVSRVGLVLAVRVTLTRAKPARNRPGLATLKSVPGSVGLDFMDAQLSTALMPGLDGRARQGPAPSEPLIFLIF